MTDSQVPRAKMGIYSYFNIITQHFGQDNMSVVIPVLEEEEKHAYELPMRRHEGKTKLEKSWKQDPPMNSHQHTKLVLHGNQEKLYYWCKCHKSWTIHSPKECRKQHSERKNFKRNTDKPKNLNRQPVRGVKNTTQKKPHSTPRTEQNESKARDEAHMSLRQMSKPKRSGNTSMHLGKYNL
jgi:hypothetical protein